MSRSFFAWLSNRLSSCKCTPQQDDNDDDDDHHHHHHHHHDLMSLSVSILVGVSSIRSISHGYTRQERVSPLRISIQRSLGILEHRLLLSIYKASISRRCLIMEGKHQVDPLSSLAAVVSLFVSLCVSSCPLFNLSLSVSRLLLSPIRVVCLYRCLSVSLSFSLSLCPSLCLSLSLSLFLSLCLSLSFSLSVSLSASLCPSLCLSLSLFLSLSLSLSLSVSLSPSLSVSLCLSLSVCVCLSLSLSVSHPSVRYTINHMCRNPFNESNCLLFLSVLSSVDFKRMEVSKEVTS